MPFGHSIDALFALMEYELGHKVHYKYSGFAKLIASAFTHVTWPRLVRYAGIFLSTVDLAMHLMLLIS